MSTEMTAAEIKRIRGKYGLSQQAFARLLGIGEASMVRYENGQTPSKANANLIRAADHPSFMAECLGRDGELISNAQREHAEQVVYAMITFDERGAAMDINEMYMLTLEQEILNEKAAEILADVSRLLMEAEAAGDEVGVALYSDVITMLAQAKGAIVRAENDSFKKLFEIRGRIECLCDLVKRSERRVA